MIRLKIKTLIILLLRTGVSFTQEFGDYLSENALQIKDNYELDSAYYDYFKNYKLILIGETHGTKEPAKLVKSISELILENEKIVSVGLEIPEELMKVFTQMPCDSTLALTKFFTKDNIDGRNGQAWFDLIKYCNTQPKIKLFFFDNFNVKKNTNRDSSMYLSILTQMSKYPQSKIITLSGGIHSKLIPYKTNPTLGNYCINDSLNFPIHSVCSINHIYSEGTILNSIGNGLELRTIDFEESVFSNSVDFKNYLIFYQTAEPSDHNCIFYSRNVNHSQKVNLSNKL